MSSSNSNAVDTNGWHTVSALKYRDVNNAIAAGNASPTSFSRTASDNSASATGTFGTWALTTGGAGADIMMAIPITGGTVTIGANQYAVTACIAPVKVTANFLPQSDTKKVLKLATKQLGDSPVASVGELQPPQSNFLVDGALRGLVEQWLNANLVDFDHVFATVDLDAQFTNAGVTWLKSSYQGYAVAELAVGATLDNSTFGVLNLIDGTQPDGTEVYQVSPYVIPTGADAGFAISSQKFLQHMMLAAVPLMFSGSPDQTAFTIDNAGTRIRNNGSLVMPSVKLDNGRTVSPTVDSSNFTIQVDTTELVIGISDMQFEYSPGITVHLNYEGRSTLSFDAVHDQLVLTTTTQSGNGSVEVSKGLQIAEIVLGVASIVLALVGGIGGVVGRSASAAVTSATTASLGVAESTGEDAAQVTNATVSALRGIISGTPAEMSQIAARAVAVARVAAVGAFCTTLMPAITQIIQAVADGDYQSMPKISDLTSNALGKAVIWPESVPNLTLTSGTLNGAMQFGLKHAS